MELAYFAAPDDAAAAEAESRPGGPLGWPVVSRHRRVGLFRREPVFERLGPAFQGFQCRGYDPMVTLGNLEILLTGVDDEALERDPRWGGSPSEVEPPDHAGVITLTDTLRDALATASDVVLNRVAEPWSRTEELTGIGWEDATIADHLDFLVQLRALASCATQRGHRLYCYFES